MATNVGSLVVKLEADLKDLKDGLAKGGDKVKEFSSKTESWWKQSKIAVTAGVGAISAAIVTSIKAYGEQEQAVVKLNQALANQGIYSAQTSKDLTDYATALQEVTTFADETIIATQAQLTAFGLQGQQLKDVTKATLDLAAAKGIDLTSAAQLLGKAFVGETGALSRYGIIIDKNTKESDKFAAVMGKVNQMFGGQAEAMRGTVLGSWASLQNQISELQETLGAFMAGPGKAVIEMLIGWIQQIVGAINVIYQMSTQFKSFGEFLKANFTLVIAAVGTAILDLVANILSGTTTLFNYVLGFLAKIPGIGTAIDGLRNYIVTGLASSQAAVTGLSTAWADQAVQMQANLNTTTEVTDRMILNENLKKDTVLFNNKIINESEKESLLEREKAWVANNVSITAKNDKLAEDLQVSTHSWSKFSIDMANQVTDQFGQGVADMILEGKKFSQVMKGLWKNMASAFIAEVARMIAKWLILQALTGGKAGGFAKIAGGMAEGGFITEPSIITGLRSGISHVAGESGPEAVVPMKNMHAVTSGANRATPVGGATGGEVNLNVTVNITGQFIEGNESVWQRLIRDKIVPEIHRLTMSNPTGMFNRRRGATA